MRVRTPDSRGSNQSSKRKCSLSVELARGLVLSVVIGVISVGARTPILVCFHKLEITPPSNSNHSRDGTFRCACDPNVATLDLDQALCRISVTMNSAKHHTGERL